MGILTFLVSFNTINFLAAFSYTQLAPQITTPMGDFAVAVLATFIPMIPGLFLYRKLIAQTYSTALLGYMPVSYTHLFHLQSFCILNV